MFGQVELRHLRSKLYERGRLLNQIRCFWYHRADEPKPGEVPCLPGDFNQIESAFAKRKRAGVKHSEWLMLQDSPLASFDLVRRRPE